MGDEWGEVAVAYRIFRGEIFPLHNAAHDIGPLFNYLLAGLFVVLGPSLYLPRLMVMVVGVGTVFLSFLLGRELFGDAVGLLAAALVATAPSHILLTHMAWSNDTTPFFVTAASLGLLLAFRKGRGWWVAAGFLWAMALQTHASVLAAVVRKSVV